MLSIHSHNMLSISPFSLSISFIGVCLFPFATYYFRRFLSYVIASLFFFLTPAFFALIEIYHYFFLHLFFFLCSFYIHSSSLTSIYSPLFSLFSLFILAPFLKSFVQFIYISFFLSVVFFIISFLLTSSLFHVSLFLLPSSSYLLPPYFFPAASFLISLFPLSFLCLSSPFPFSY